MVNGENEAESPSYFEQLQDHLTDLRASGGRSIGRLSIMPIHQPNRRLATGQYFLKKGFCIITHRVPSSEKLNSINIYLRKCLQGNYMFAQFEDYITSLIFTVPLPL